MTLDELKAITEKSAGLIARFASDRALLSQEDVATMLCTTRDSRLFRSVLGDPNFPKPVFLGERSKRWFSADVRRYLENRQR